MALLRGLWATVARWGLAQLRLVVGELQVADVHAQVGLSLFTGFEDFSVFKPAPQHETSVTAMLDQVVAWGSALKPLRQV
jgi:alpha/beta superfamily hydrolase